jgi:small GTP-binding protein
VGKTKLLARFADKSYNASYVSTIGVDFKVQTIMLDDKKVKFQIWDTAGQERYRTIAQTYYKGASGVILAYSVTDPESLSHICTVCCNAENWTSQIRENAQANIKMCLVGNKMDDI